MNEQIEAIRNEIKRLEEIHERNLKKPMERGRIGYAHGVVACCDRILSFLDSLPEGPDKGLDVTDFCKPIDPGIAKCVADHWWEMMEEEPDKSLEDAARLYAIPHYTKDIDVHHIEEYSYDTGLEAAFIAGAEWQKKQDQETIELAEDHAYLAGAVNEREKMLKEAVEGTIYGCDGLHWIETDADENIKGKEGDKVRSSS